MSRGRSPRRPGPHPGVEVAAPLGRRLAGHGLALAVTAALNLALVLGLDRLRAPRPDEVPTPPSPARRVLTAPPPPAPPPPPRVPPPAARALDPSSPALPALDLASPIAAPAVGVVDEFALGPVGVAGTPGAPGADDAALRLPPQAELVLDESLVDTPPTVLDAPPPRYPPQARADGVEGAVVLQLLVGEDGRVEDVRVVSATPPGVFEAEARRAVRRWRLQPATFKGRPVRAWARQSLRFDLR